MDIPLPVAYLVVGFIVSLGLAGHWHDNKGWPESLEDLTALELVLLLFCIPEILIYVLAKWKPFKSKRKLR